MRSCRAACSADGPHRPVIRTSDGRLWVVNPRSAARAEFAEKGPGPRHVVVTAALDERTGVADVSAVSDAPASSSPQPAAH